MTVKRIAMSCAALMFLIITASLHAQDPPCPGCSGYYDVGSTVTLTATPEPGSIFNGWSGDPECEAGQHLEDPTKTTVTMETALDCVATFQPMQVSVPVQFEATCNDPEEGDITASLTFTSDLDGSLGNGGSFIVNMSEGVHQVSGQCCDSAGACYDEIRTVTVAQNDPPVVIWTLPADGACVGDDCP